MRTEDASIIMHHFKGLSLRKILEVTGGEWVNSESISADVQSLHLKQIATLGTSTSHDVAFFFSRDYENELLTACPGVLITAAPFVKPLEAAPLPIWKKSAVVVCSDPYYAMALLSKEFAKFLSHEAHLERPKAQNVHPTAVVHPSAEIGHQVEIRAYAVIDENVKIGDGCVIYPHCYVGNRVHLGNDCVLFHGVTLYEDSWLGDRVRIHAGSRIGADGFGYSPIRDEKKVIGHQKIYHLGKVVLEDDVEVGANSCVDRSTFGDTRVARSAKLDNHVHIGHNAQVGEGTIVCGGTCLAGGASTGRYVYVGGMSGLSNRVHVGDYAQIGAGTFITKDAPAGGIYSGIPFRTLKDHLKIQAMLTRLLNQRKKGRENQAP